ncbi:helix-turn-helix transcriptional regulator [Hymenobacter mucosus]|uniref:HTH domain-containing protein n=1 Tax=Hymenobacter mucosus TaxID=1411120 RepID=A0A239AET5_9BACT|nr:HTH domain-containing protein [Hymenobacter mucosus]SNR93882.1 HTH domain-containing protein [Hymenobacter mucosus]
MNRFDRVTAILLQLQAKRVVSGPTLAQQFGVSLRTIYRDLRTLEEATTLLTAVLTAQLTDAPTARFSGAAMDKVRAVLRRSERDHLATIAPHVQVFAPRN